MRHNDDLYPFKDIKILIADDDSRMTRLVKSILSIFGFRDITVAYDGSEALDLIHKQDFHFVIIDWEMHRMDGIDFVRAIRKDANSIKRYIPILMLTGKAGREDVQEARDAGVNEFLVKPFTVNDMRNKVSEIIDNPRYFIVTDTYVGPDRRRRNMIPPDGVLKRQEDTKNR